MLCGERIGPRAAPDCRAGFQCPRVKETQRGSLESVSVWSERDYLVSTSSQAGARTGACTCISKPVNRCVFVCTPAIFL